MISKYSKRQWLILCVYSVVNLLSAFGFSIQGPFFPMIAEMKGATPTDNGLIFGAYSLVIIFINPLVIVMINKFGAVRVSFSGLLNHWNFIVVLFVSLSVILRIIEGLGYAMGRNAGIAIISSEFCEKVEIAFGIVQAFFSSGLLIGPVAGGALYELGGFYLPFLLIGVLLVCIAFVVLCLHKDYPKHGTTSRKEVVKLLSQTSVILGMLAIFGAFLNLIFVSSTLEIHIKSLNLSPVQVGAVFLCNGIASIFSSLFWGLLFEKYDKPLLFCSLSAVINIFGMLLLGPAPYLLLDLNIYTCVFGLLIHGVGIRGEQIGGFSLLNKGISLAGLPKNIQTYGLVSALYMTFYALGSFIGPLLGGYLFDVIGFPWGSHLFIVYHLVFSIIMIIFNYLLSGRSEQKENEKKQSSTETIIIYGSIAKN
ncbi:MFS-type transporter [Armadillidium nasatum]|uniref:MFS-type transporter n=1 Tax=Armadillidium nasatum TaxID=96803 RepID=A0A5N5T609_9CRUS|nr:MFS-type transporter [Armadillidium nasatum]